MIPCRILHNAALQGAVLGSNHQRRRLHDPFMEVLMRPEPALDVSFIGQFDGPEVESNVFQLARAVGRPSQVVRLNVTRSFRSGHQTPVDSLPRTLHDATIVDPDQMVAQFEEDVLRYGQPDAKLHRDSLALDGGHDGASGAAKTSLRCVISGSNRKRCRTRRSVLYSGPWGSMTQRTLPPERIVTLRTTKIRV
ncbi:uncharacterized protein LOC129602725 [Paramacrobiotus metropolitanus]|uniref:uncharacterized protein LOC129602725 n=1 Tax=Paramacrobiotus metropolitanus TaxID=2943436 RepID=UPI002445A1D4|nr:uncharacterized protein LOC129602725 [Paramacrobiotus metropolitanus]